MLKVHLDKPSFAVMGVNGTGDKFYVFCDRDGNDIEYVFKRVDASEKVELSRIRSIMLRNVDEDLYYDVDDALALFFFNTGYGTITVVFERDGSKVRIFNPYPAIRCVVVTADKSMEEDWRESTPASKPRKDAS
jgi:hypothetical protein